MIRDQKDPKNDIAKCENTLKFSEHYQPVDEYICNQIVVKLPVVIGFTAYLRIT